MSLSAKGPPAAKGKSNTQHAVSALRSMIVDNKLAPGSNHLESELADMLEMSRTPIREAIMILAAQRLVEVKPRHGIHILALSLADMAEIYEILTVLESLAAQLAAARKHEADEFERADQAIATMDHALNENDRSRWAEADEIFHRELVRLSGNQRIANITEMYNDQVRRARSLTLHLRPEPVKSNDDHRNVLRAIRDGEPERAHDLHKAHRLQAMHMILSLLEKYGFHQV